MRRERREIRPASHSLTLPCDTARRVFGGIRKSWLHRTIPDDHGREQPFPPLIEIGVSTGENSWARNGMICGNIGSYPARFGSRSPVDAQALSE
jgi:hypothetical protein